MRKIFRRLILVLAVFGLLIGAWEAANLVWENRQEKQAGGDLKPSLPPDDEPGGKKKPISFGELRLRNGEVVGWVKVDNTRIDHPVVQGQDNKYYLRYDFNRRSSKFGAAFLDYRVRADFSDFNSVIYGHHIRNNNRMFHDLILFKDKAFFNSNHTGTLYTPTRTIPFEIFAVALTEPYADFFRYDLLTPKQREEHIAYIKKNAMHYREIELGPDDHILILSTCSYEFNEARTLIAAKLAW